MKRLYRITTLTAAGAILAAMALCLLFFRDEEARRIKVGFIHIGDASITYTANFLKAEEALEQNLGEQVELADIFNVSEDDVETVQSALDSLADNGCELIFTTSFGYGETVKEYAKNHPSIQFCQATCANANEEPVLPNYHTFMGEIYEGRYVAGVVAGMKLREMTENKMITAEQAKIGYVGAFPYAEVISGYTAFFLGVRSVMPEATMVVQYTGSWSNYILEKRVAQELIQEGCIIISQHSDTIGPAEACESADKYNTVYHIGYNQNMINIAPTTHLISCRINWAPYILSATKAVLDGKRIESCVDAHIHGNDAGSGFDKGWVEMLHLNELLAAPGTQRKIDELVKQFECGSVEVFQGPYLGTDPFDPSDTVDLREGYQENASASAPSFHYVLQDVITIRKS